MNKQAVLRGLVRGIGAVLRLGVRCTAVSSHQLGRVFGFVVCGCGLVVFKVVAWWGCRCVMGIFLVFEYFFVMDFNI